MDGPHTSTPLMPTPKGYRNIMRPSPGRGEGRGGVPWEDWVKVHPVLLQDRAEMSLLLPQPRPQPLSKCLALP